MSGRITIFCGHYGSGKSTLAVSYSLELAGKGIKTVLADMDIVNPYFRSADYRDFLSVRGVDVIASPYAGSNVDLPSLPSELYSMFSETDRHFVLDVGGDDRGALALGRFRKQILQENDFNNFFVVNFYRPLTRDAESAFQVMNEIYVSCGIPFTSIINNSNLGAETDDVTLSATLAEEKKLCEISGLSVSYVPVDKSVIRGVF